jgi:flavin-binding protein dodecin
MPNSTYKVIELVGSSVESWEQAARNAVETAAQSLTDLRIAEVTKLDLRIEDNQIVAYRVRLNLSFKYLSHEHAETRAAEPPARAPKRKRK